MYLSLKFLGTVQAARFVCLLLPPKDLYQISVKAWGALLTPSLAQVYFCKVLLWVFFGLLPSCLLTADLLQWSATEGKYRTHSVQFTLWFLTKTDFQFYQTTNFPTWIRYLKEMLNDWAAPITGMGRRQCLPFSQKKTELRKIHVSGTVGDPLLTRKSPTCAYISQKLW